MKKFLALYMAPAATIRALVKSMSPETNKAEMDAWMTWAKANEKSVVDLGMPLGKTKRVSVSGVADTKNQITGYSIVQGASAAGVAKIFKKHPHMRHKGASVDILDIVQLPGM
ncbi:hypothetical protein BH10PSE9_BH10PSE9_01620 [soil metagenome]